VLARHDIHQVSGKGFAFETSMSSPLPVDVVSLAEIAEAAGVPLSLVESLAARGAIRTLAAGADGLAGGEFAAFTTFDEAACAVAGLGHGTLVPPSGPEGVPLFTTAGRPHASPAAAIVMSSGAHALIAAALILASLSWPTTATEPAEPLTPAPQDLRLVFLATPGPGGGGGGGGSRQPAPPVRAERQGERALSSPIPARQLPPPVPTPRPAEPIDTRPLVAPVAVMAADARDQEGIVDEAPEATGVDDAGPGGDAGAGTGEGAGLGAGEGSGIGDGTGGGMGGGPYRPGSGVEPPRLLREVRAEYTDEARRAGIEGDVLLEVVVRRDGTVGEVRLLRGLQAGLDARAVQAVRQWRFVPARLRGTAVDVVVEVAVEFRLR
jgi:protein TonB